MSQISTRSRGQVRKGSSRTASAPRLRKKVVPKLVSTRPKRTPNVPKNSNSADHVTSSQRDEDIAADTDVGDITDIATHQGNNSNIPQTVSNFENVRAQSVDLADSTALGIDVDLNTSAINVDDFFAHHQIDNDVITNNSIDVLTSDDTELLELTGGTSNCGETSTQQEQPANPSHLDRNRTEDSVSEGLRASVVDNDIPTPSNDDVTDVGVGDTQEQATPKQNELTNTTKKVGCAILNDIVHVHMYL